MTKIHRYIGLNGAKQIWKETGEKFIDNTELDYVLSNIQFNFDGNYLTLLIPSISSDTPRKVTVDLSQIIGGSGEATGVIKEYLSAGRYDEATGKPNFAGNPNVIYLVPSSGSADTNEYTEWMYDSEKGWEMMGAPSISSEDISSIVNGIY